MSSVSKTKGLGLDLPCRLSHYTRTNMDKFTEYDLENVFYETFSEIYDYIQQNIFDDVPFDNEIINIGFWPGGDRDGNPFVLPETTLNVAERLKQTIIKNYYNDVRKLKRKLKRKNE